MKMNDLCYAKSSHEHHGYIDSQTLKKIYNFILICFSYIFSPQGNKEQLYLALANRGESGFDETGDCK